MNEFCSFISTESRFPLTDSHLLPHGGAAGPHGCQLRRHRQSFGPSARLREGHAWVVDPGGHDARCAAHLLGQEDGAVGQLVGLSTGLLPHGNLLGQQLLALEEREAKIKEALVANAPHRKAPGDQATYC